MFIIHEKRKPKLKMVEEIKIEFEFSKTKMSVTVSAYLMDRANSPDLKDSLQRAINGNKPSNYTQQKRKFLSFASQ